MRSPASENLVSVGAERVARAAAGADVRHDADRWARLHASAASGEVRDPAESLRLIYAMRQDACEQVARLRGEEPRR